MNPQQFFQTFNQHYTLIPYYPSHQYPMIVPYTSSHPPVDVERVKQIVCPLSSDIKLNYFQNYLKVILSQICGESQAIRPMMLKDLLVLVTESDWVLSTIPYVEYIKPLEQYCGKAKPCDVPLQLAKYVLSALSNRIKSNLAVRSFLRNLTVPSASPETSSELVPFAGRLCSSLFAHVSQIKSLFTESSSVHPAISAHSATLPGESPLLTGNTVSAILCAKFSLLESLLLNSDITFEDILINWEFVPLLKSSIITCLDLLRQLKCESNSPSADRSTALIEILDRSWSCLASCLFKTHKTLFPVIESALSNVQQLFSLLERTCRHSSPNSNHLRMIVNITAYLPHLIPHMLEENLVQRIINASKPMTVPTKNGAFHLSLISTFLNLIYSYNITEDNEELKRIRLLQFERLLKPARDYLQFILHREEFILKDDSCNNDLPTIIGKLSFQTLVLERELLEDGEIVETGREEWEVRWLVEKTDEGSLEPRLKKIREDDVKMKRDEKERWKKRVWRQREAGHEDAMEGWLMRLDEETRSEIVDYLESVTVESGMNNSM
ncbi:hypothetical protein BLNAU_19906 [Blattamonas nauphoetae]|uniref:Uncharacterized protein n=1 Tax=Blattamonas nauphoetae TaxID=2049346 RepID=A0ABQ9X058_9EUKA|nr:hypothetical protein BLNAU_19906 [Blattamonas nauphoetae]